MTVSWLSYYISVKVLLLSTATFFIHISPSLSLTRPLSFSLHPPLALLSIYLSIYLSHTHLHKLSLYLSPSPFAFLSHILELNFITIFLVICQILQPFSHFRRTPFYPSHVTYTLPSLIINSDRGGPGPQGGFRRDDRDRDMHPQGPGHGGQGMRNRGYSSGTFYLFYSKLYFVFHYTNLHTT